MAARILATGAPVLVNDLPADDPSTAVLRARGVRALIGAPLRVRGRIIGLIHIGCTVVPARFSQEDALFLQDVADRIAAALEHARLHDEAQRAIRARDEFLETISHDVRSPLWAIIVRADQLEAEARRSGAGRPDVNRITKAAQMIQRAAGRINRLISDLLDAAALACGHLSIALEAHDVKPLLDEVKEVFSSAAAVKSLTLETRLEAPGLRALCDPLRMSQVLSNLVGNAVKFTPEGGAITVTAARVGAEVQLSVADTGPGLSAEEASHVFDRYYQCHATEPAGGLGLGLSLVKDLVQAHHGRVWVESAPGAGSTFHVAVPSA